jgi:prophage regulatory protein
MKNHLDISLPIDGFSRWQQIKQFLPISRETWRKMVRAGRAPQPIKMGLRCTMYQNSDLHEFLQDMTNYKTESKK